jgi:hypothetical protein
VFTGKAGRIKYKILINPSGKHLFTLLVEKKLLKSEKMKIRENENFLFMFMTGS